MLQHSIDHICIRDGQIFSYGWGFFEGKTVKNLEFHYQDCNGNAHRVDVDYGRQRDDVKVFFAGVEAAENAGFLLLAGSASNSISSGFLRWYMDDSSAIDTPISLESEEKTSTVSKFKMAKIFLVKLFFLFRKAGIKSLFEKIKKYLTGRPHTLSGAEWLKLRESLKGKSLALIVDHDMGGGANIYRNDLIAEKSEDGFVVVLLSYHVASLQYFVQVFDGESSTRYSIATPEALLNIFSSVSLKEIFYNCAVTFKNPLSIVYVLLNLKSSYSARLTVAIHDYFLVCPSHFLLNNKAVFCNVPEKSVCDTCMQNHTDGFVSLTGSKDVSLWRSEWSKLLGAADEVRLFSHSSYRLLKKAYPSLPDHNWQIKPHKLKSEIPLINLNAGEDLHIGIIGAIGKHKGSQVIAALANEIRQKNAGIKITVIGTIEAKVDNKIVTVTGEYKAKDLAHLIGESKANVFLFPSICPETFSYVSHEIIQMGLPYACFDLGAPSDLARSYKNGIVLSSFDSKSVLNELMTLRNEFYNLKNEQTI